MLDLSAITLLCIETRDPALAHFAIQKCTQLACFGKVVLITDLEKISKRADDAVDPKVDQAIIRLSGIEYVQAPPIKTTKDYSDLLLNS